MIHLVVYVIKKLIEMTIRLQKETLKYLLQFKEALTLIEKLDSNIFDLQEDKFVFNLLKKFIEKNKMLPKKIDLIDFFETKAVKKGYCQEDIDIYTKYISNNYTKVEATTDILRKECIKSIQVKLTKEMFLNNAGNIDSIETESFFETLMSDMNNILDLSKDEMYSEQMDGGYLLKDHHKNPIINITNDIIPLYLKGMNKSTAYGGVKAPELCILMAAPKGFKTGNMLVLALELVRSGYKVHYADTENGVKSIRTRLLQAILETDVITLMDDEEQSTLDALVRQLSYAGGDLKINLYPMWRCSLQDVESNIKRDRENDNFHPDIIVYDNLDNFIPSKGEARKKDRRLQIQEVYAEALGLNAKYNIPSFTISQVNRKAVEKETFSMTDLAEDFGKAAIAHKAWAICATKEEKDAGISRIVSAFQREGIGDGHLCCFVKIDKAKMSIKEITEIEAMQQLDGYIKSSSPDEDKYPRLTPKYNDNDNMPF